MTKMWESFCKSSKDQHRPKEDLPNVQKDDNALHEEATAFEAVNDTHKQTSILKPTNTENSKETQDTASEPKVQISEPNVQKTESRSNLGHNFDDKVGMRDQLGDSVDGVGTKNSICATGEATGSSIDGKLNQQKLRSNTQQKISTDNDLVGPERRESNKYVFDVGSIKVLVYNQSVVDIQKMDAIVNAANDNMAHAGGIAYFISKAAGKDMDDECYKHVKKNGPLKVAEVFVSKPGKMKCKGIFHAVGPRWSEYIGREDKCAEDLYKTIYRCLENVVEKRWRHIALCAISSGIFGVPKRLCTTMYLKAIEDFAIQHPKSVIDVHFIDVAQEILNLMQSVHQERLTHGYTPNFNFAFMFPSAQRGFQGHKYSQSGIRPDRDWNARPSVERRGQGGTSPYKPAQPQPSYVEWIEYKPEKIHDVEIDVEKYGKLASMKSKTGLLQVETTSVGQCVYHTDKPAAKKLSCGHKFCNLCYIQSKIECQKCKVEKKADTTVKKSKCPICMEDYDSLSSLPCKHELCKDCLKQIADVKPVCPICSVPFGIVTGTQPDGRMFFRTVFKALPGYASSGTIEIRYEFKDGKQEKCHPSPGKRYNGITRTAYLPDNDEGRKVLRLLQKAFSRRLVFTIGDSRTTGQTGQITWNDIHHKTSPYEGKFGYPDETYLSRVQDELAAKGITE